MAIKQSVLICFGMTLVLMTAGTAAAATLNVTSITGPQNYTTIQQAVDNATTGDTILVYPETYEENVVVSQSNITIRSQSGNPADTTVQANSSGHVFSMTANNVTISGFEIRHASSSHAGIYLAGSNNTLANNTVEFNGYGIWLEGSDNNNLVNNSASVENGYGIYLQESDYNDLTDNSARENDDYGIYLTNSDYNNLTSNTASENDDHGIYLQESDYNDLTDNSARENDDYGIYLTNSDYNNLTSNKAPGDHYYQETGIYLYGSSDNNLTDNTASKNNDYGIHLQESDDNDLINNTASKNDDYGIYLQESDYNDLINNTASKYQNTGIYLDYESDSNTLTSNKASDNDDYGIWLEGSDYNNLTSNMVEYNDYGIYLFDNCYDNDLISNTASNNNYGIWLDGSDDNELSNNTAFNNTLNGIHLSGSYYNELSNNTASNNTLNGIWLDHSDDNELSNNTVEFNNCGINLHESYHNTIYNNYFNNTIYNVGGTGDGNVWNITKTNGTNIIGGPYLGGNYWSDYTGVDTDGDGFGNTFLPYNSSGHIFDGGDYLPLVVPNSAPIANASGPYEVDENTTIIFNASASSDPDGDALTYRWDFDNDGTWDTGWSSNLTANYTWDDDWIGEVRLEVNDSKTTTNDTANVIVNNVAPVIDNLDLPIASVTIGSTVNLSATFTDPGADNHTYSIDWDDGNESSATLAFGVRTVDANHTYATTGFYNVTLTVEDDDDGSGTASRYVIVHDPDGGSVAGKGSFDSLAGAYYPDDSVKDEATFEFDSKYNKKGVPAGETQFMFKEADLEFQSESYYWLVIEGHKATFRGNGTVNDESGYEFLVSAINGDDDMFRMKIWNSTDIIYDNNVGGDIDADPITEIEKGKIQIKP